MVLISEQQINKSVDVKRPKKNHKIFNLEEDTHRGLDSMKICNGVAQEVRKLQYL